MSRRQSTGFIGGVLCLVAALFTIARWNQALPPHQFGAAIAALDRGDFASAEAALRTLEADLNNESQSRIVRAALLMRRAEWAAALNELNHVPTSGRSPDLLSHMQGECLYRLGRLTEAESVMRRLAAQNPHDVAAYRWLGAIYYDIGAYDASIEALIHVAELAPSDYSPHRLTGLMLLDFERYGEAATAYRNALERSPPPAVRTEIYDELGRCLIAVRDYEAALEVLEESESSALTLARRSECHWSLGELESADGLLAEAYELDSDEPAVLLLQARMAMDSGRYDDAIESLQKVVERNPFHKDARYQLALAYQRLPDEARYRIELDQWQALDQRYRRLTELSTAAIHDPQNAQLREELAEVCESLGKHELAAMWRNVAESIRRGPGEVRSSGDAAAVVEQLRGRSGPTSPD